MAEELTKEAKDVLAIVAKAFAHEKFLRMSPFEWQLQPGDANAFARYAASLAPKPPPCKPGDWINVPWGSNDLIGLVLFSDNKEVRGLWIPLDGFDGESGVLAIDAVDFRHIRIVSPPSWWPTPAATADDPNMDGTDAAHPAWWRGNDDGVLAMVDRVNRILDGKDDGSGKAANSRVQALRERLLKLVKSAAAAPTSAESAAISAFASRSGVIELLFVSGSWRARFLSHGMAVATAVSATIEGAIAAMAEQMKDGHESTAAPAPATSALSAADVDRMMNDLYGVTNDLFVRIDPDQIRGERKWMARVSHFRDMRRHEHITENYYATPTAALAALHAKVCGTEAKP